jgi:hypothetical protein
MTATRLLTLELVDDRPRVEQRRAMSRERRLASIDRWAKALIHYLDEHREWIEQRYYERRISSREWWLEDLDRDDLLMRRSVADLRAAAAEVRRLVSREVCTTQFKG